MQSVQRALNLGHDGLVVGLNAIQPAVNGGHGRKKQKREKGRDEEKQG